jgi:hypothetical protein
MRFLRKGGRSIMNVAEKVFIFLWFRPAGGPGRLIVG